MQYYPLETKRKAARLVEEEHQTYAAVAAKLGIRKAERIEAWYGCIGRKGRYPSTNLLGDHPKPRQSKESWNGYAWRTPC